eukprot:TRINITY_DN11624_c0_g2_i1.p1 TRINITY_DN11624_c0_g2~~TRINITY_DN11624_c0_g2_i1.p1  ORF type:complete len:413 (+),score=68.84 TRINITY_DN11624_c0_g2_i1:82-1320(+)
MTVSFRSWASAVDHSAAVAYAVVGTGDQTSLGDADLPPAADSQDSAVLNSVDLAARDLSSPCGKGLPSEITAMPLPEPIAAAPVAPGAPAVLEDVPMAEAPEAEDQAPAQARAESTAAPSRSESPIPRGPGIVASFPAHLERPKQAGYFYGQDLRARVLSSDMPPFPVKCTRKFVPSVKFTMHIDVDSDDGGLEMMTTPAKRQKVSDSQVRDRHRDEAVAKRVQAARTLQDLAEILDGAALLKGPNGEEPAIEHLLLLHVNKRDPPQFFKAMEDGKVRNVIPDHCGVVLCTDLTGWALKAFLPLDSNVLDLIHSHRLLLATPQSTTGKNPAYNVLVMQTFSFSVVPKYRLPVHVAFTVLGADSEEFEQCLLELQKAGRSAMFIEWVHPLDEQIFVKLRSRLGKRSAGRVAGQ